MVATNTHPEVIQLLETPETLKIDEVRALRKELSLSRLTGKYRVAIITEARRLTPEAESALLKTLEEPPEGVVMILTDSTGQLATTIQSRCQRVLFSPWSDQEMEAALTDTKLPMSKKAEVVALAVGRPAAAARLVDDPEFFSELQGTHTQAESILQMELPESFALAEQLAKDPELTSKLEDWQGHYRRLLLAKRGVTKADDQEELSKYSDKGLLMAVTAIEDTKDQLRRHAQPRLALEVLILKIRKVAR
jgi:DNA polymerase-3 subunit delta'